jgi:hypothetical protein
MSKGNTFIIDEIGKIAESANHMVEVRDGQLRLINRNQDAAANVAQYRAPVLVKVDIKQGMPIRRLKAEYQQNIPYPHTRQLQTQQQSAVIQIQPYGQDVNVDPLSQVEEEVQRFLSAYYEIIKRPRTNALLQGIHSFGIGEKIEVFDEKLEVLSVITVDTISWNFKEETTTSEGYSVITHMRDY